ncbi:hypothetical protein SAMN05216179_2830 [Gracilibacillus kekensis]|uniref:Uncharacterized protein n=1 Tax=Gracilibacillus kekensis TaxID=1027249 RepID=A0A1M7Q770_9BACI|nr:hypothetical protein SAMN05216179_2830 [Gracilibacillus kekensis]
MSSLNFLEASFFISCANQGIDVPDEKPKVGKRILIFLEYSLLGYKMILF